MLNRILPLVLCALAACSSMEDYVYPAPSIGVEPTAFDVAAEGTALAYDEAFAPLPVIHATLDGRAARVLIATRRNQHSIAPHAVPEGALAEGEATVPVLTADGIVPEVRQVVRVSQLQLGGAQLEGLLLLVEPLPDGIDVALSHRAFPGAVVTLDGPARELRVVPGRLPPPEERGSESVRLQLEFLMGACAADAPRFWATIMVAAASGLDGGLMVGLSTSRVIETSRGPELLPAGPGALEPHFTGARKVRMDGVFGEDHPRARARIVDDLGSGWLVLGAQYLAEHVLELDPEHRLARLR